MPREQALSEPVGDIYDCAIDLALVEGATPHQIAERFNTAIATVRTHMRRLLEKTGTTRQAELVRKVLRMNPPVAR